MTNLSQFAFLAAEAAAKGDNPEPLPFAGPIGLIAPIALLLAYALLTMGKLTAKHYSYQWMNVIGAAALTYTVVSPLNVGVFVTEALWTLIGIYGVYKIFVERKQGDASASSKPRVK
ncbi:MAG: hypothetical protein Q4P66_05535 [Actinomycetaceae bacterium]|nr:hypothetical protein [Actinomycetaceae bacterium]